MKTYPAKELKNKIGSVLSVANREPVGITRNGHFSYVIVSAEDWKNMQGNKPHNQSSTAIQVPDIPEKQRKKNWAECEAVGMWADREDMEDVAAYVRNIRKPRF